LALTAVTVWLTRLLSAEVSEEPGGESSRSGKAVGDGSGNRDDTFVPLQASETGPLIEQNRAPHATNLLGY